MEHTNNPVVGIVMGSDSDWPIVSKATEILRNFGIAFEVRVISTTARRSSIRYATEAESRGLRVILAAANAAHSAAYWRLYRAAVLGILFTWRINGLTPCWPPSDPRHRGHTDRFGGPVNAAILAFRF